MKSAGRPIRRPTARRPSPSRGPNANAIVAASSSHGTIRVNARSGVESSSSAPIRPPARLRISSAKVATPSSGWTSSRYAHELASVPGNRATVLDALATVGGSPASVSAGKVTNVPPPATAFMAPATNPAAANTTFEPTVTSVIATGPRASASPSGTPTPPSCSPGNRGGQPAAARGRQRVRLRSTPHVDMDGDVAADDEVVIGRRLAAREHDDLRQTTCEMHRAAVRLTRRVGGAGASSHSRIGSAGTLRGRP